MPDTPNIAIIGNSHVNCVAHALAMPNCPHAERVQVINLNQEEHLARAFLREADPSPLIDRIRERQVDDAPTFWCMMIGGNEHNIRGLLRHPRHFDFVVPHRPDLFLDETAERLTYGFVRATFDRILSHYKPGLSALRDRAELPVLSIESPPPKGDDDFVKANLDKYFHDNMEDLRLSGRDMRLKMWIVRSEAMRALCQNSSLEYLHGLEGTTDTDGFLLPEFWPRDATHANREYGRLLIEHVVAVGRDMAAGARTA